MTLHDFSINPLSMDISWEIDDPILSDKDRKAITFNKYKEENYL